MTLKRDADRRKGIDRREFNDPDYEDQERRSGNSRRSGTDRRNK